MNKAPKIIIATILTLIAIWGAFAPAAEAIKKPSEPEQPDNRGLSAMPFDVDVERLIETGMDNEMPRFQAFVKEQKIEGENPLRTMFLVCLDGVMRKYHYSLDKTIRELAQRDGDMKVDAVLHQTNVYKFFDSAFTMLQRDCKETSWMIQSGLFSTGTLNAVRKTTRGR